jgi:hypothetical protein
MKTLLKFLGIIASGPALMILHHETPPGWPMILFGITDPFYNSMVWCAGGCVVFAVMMCGGIICFGGDEWNPYLTDQERQRAREERK